jgi:hypothetical protein
MTGSMTGAMRVTRRGMLAAGLASLATRSAAAASRDGPRLLIRAEDVARARAQAERDPEAARLHGTLRDRAHALLREPVTTRAFEPRRPVMLPTSRQLLQRVLVLGAANLLAPDAGLVAQARAELASCAGFVDWNPSHFLDTAEMAAGFALALDWLGRDLDADARRALVRTLVDKALVPGREQFRRGTFWTRVAHNWNLVCNGGLVLAALAVEDEEPALAAEMLGLCLASARGAFASFAPDGGWNEGPAYWDYATQYAVYLAAALESAGKPNPFAAVPGFAQTGRFRRHMESPAGRVFNFADAGEGRARSPQLEWLARRYGDPVDAAWSRRAIGANAEPLAILWRADRAALPESAAEPRAAWFKGTDTVAMRARWGDANAPWLAIKGGSNSANHAHLDLGSFVFETGARRFAIDLGPEDYALPGYWSAETRFRYYRCSSQGHNVVTPEGRNQHVRAAARVASLAESRDEILTRIDLDAAYAPARWQRGAALAGDALVLRDEIERPTAERWIWAWHTRGRIAIDGRVARIAEGAQQLTVTLVEPDGLAFSVEDARGAPPANPNDGVRKLVVAAPAAAGPLRLAVVASPAAAPPAALARARTPLAGWPAG